MDFQVTFCYVFSMISVAKIGSHINMRCLDMHDEQANTCSCLLSSSYQASFILIKLPYFTYRLYKCVFKDFRKVIFTVAARYKSVFMKYKMNVLLNICNMNYGLKNIHLANTYSWRVMYIINVWVSLNSWSFKHRNLKCTDKRIDLYIHTESN